MNKTIEITFKDALNEPFLEILRSIIKGSKKDDKGLNGDLNNSIPEINLKGGKMQSGLKSITPRKLFLKYFKPFLKMVWR